MHVNTRIDTWHAADQANDVAEYEPRTMRTGADGARMETHRVTVGGVVRAQLTLNVDALTRAERDELIGAMRDVAARQPAGGERGEGRDQS